MKLRLLLFYATFLVKKENQEICVVFASVIYRIGSVTVFLGILTIDKISIKLKET